MRKAFETIERVYDYKNEVEMLRHYKTLLIKGFRMKEHYDNSCLQEGYTYTAIYTKEVKC